MKTHRSRTLVTLTLILSVATAACRRTPSGGGSPPPARPNASVEAGAGAPPPAVSMDPPAAAEEFREAAAKLPQGTVGAWRQSGTVVRSNAANLSQIIDGAAVSYEQYGVRNFAKGDYRKPGTSLVATVEVYEFADALGAFGRYTLMLANGRDPSTLESQGVRMGQGGYQGTTQLAFWKGRHLVQINLADESDEPDEQALARAARESLPALASAVESRIEAAPEPNSPLPTENLVWGGNTYVAEGVFGAESTGPAWVGHYRTNDGKRYRLAILVRDSVAATQSTLAALQGSGSRVAIQGLADQAFAMTLGAVGETIVARRGNTLFVIADGGAPDQAALDRAGKVANLQSVLQALPAIPTGAPAAARH